MNDTAHKYWTRFAASALINAGVYVAYRLYVQHLKNQDKKESTSAPKSKTKPDKKNFKTYQMQDSQEIEHKSKTVKKPRGRRPRVVNNGMANPVPKLRASKKNPVPGVKSDE